MISQALIGAESENFGWGLLSESGGEHSAENEIYHDFGCFPIFLKNFQQ